MTLHWLVWSPGATFAKNRWPFSLSLSLLRIFLSPSSFLPLLISHLSFLILIFWFIINWWSARSWWWSVSQWGAPKIISFEDGNERELWENHLHTYKLLLLILLSLSLSSGSSRLFLPVSSLSPSLHLVNLSVSIHVSLRRKFVP